MRIIQLGFQLHASQAEAEFAQANERVYQPFLALLERNAQKYGQRLKVSLVVTGPWLEQAARQDRQLVERLRKLVRGGTVEPVATTSYHSLAIFYDRDEATTQVEQYQERLEQELGKKSRLLVLPELTYSDAVGQWAEKIGFAGMLVGGGSGALDWRSPNHVYEAAGCKYLRLLFQNVRLSQLVARADAKILAEKTQEDGLRRRVLSAERFQKLLDLDVLRGSLINLYFDAGVIAERRGDGVIGFFDDLFENWLAVKGNRFVGAMEACVLETPTAEIAVKLPVSWRDDVLREQGAERTELVALGRDQESKVEPPRWLMSDLQQRAARLIYGLRKEILASEDEKLIERFRQLTALSVVDELEAGREEELEKQVEKLRKQANEVKKTQAVEISRVYTKKRDRGMDSETAKGDDVAVKVNFATRGGVDSGAMHGAATEAVEEKEPVKRLAHLEPAAPQTTAPAARQLEITEPGVEVAGSPKLKKIRKIIKKLVIE